MTGEPRGFDVSEFERRTGALQRAMQAADLDALLLTTEPDIRYVTGFLTRFWESPTRSWFVIVPTSGAPVAVIPSIGAALMARTWIEDIRTWMSPDPDDDGIGLLVSALRELVPTHGRVGVPMGRETQLRMPLADYERLTSKAAPLRFADATAVLRGVREVKSETEVDRIRASCRVAGRAFDHVADFAGPGCPLDRVFREFQIACLREGADWVAYLAGGAGPGGYEDVIAPASTEPLATGDILMLDTGVIRDGYYCDFDRNFAIGRADGPARRAHDTLFEATEAGLAAARPGATAADLWEAMHAAITRRGGTPTIGRMGHGLGIQLTEWPSLMPSDHTVLREGMVLTLEPGVETAPGRIMVHEENLVLRASGGELLSERAPAELPVLGPAERKRVSDQ